MIATTVSEKRVYKVQAKCDNALVYFEYVLDTCGSGGLGHVRKHSSFGVMSAENAAKVQKLMNEIQRESYEKRSLSR